MSALFVLIAGAGLVHYFLSPHTERDHAKYRVIGRSGVTRATRRRSNNKWKDGVL